MPPAYLSAPSVYLNSAQHGCGKIPYTRTEAMRRKRARSPFEGNRVRDCGFNPHGLNVYSCDICGGGVYHTGHLPPKKSA